MRPFFARFGWLFFPWLVHCSATAGGEAPSAPRPRALDAAPRAPAAPPPQVVFAPTGKDPLRVRVEVMQTPEDRQRGLMFRKQLEADAGMLFIFERAQPLTFWMHNTYLPLDMIFVTEELTILGIVENAVPLTDAPRGVPGLSRYVVEVNAGFSRRHGLTPGTKLSFSNLPGPNPR